MTSCPDPFAVLNTEVYVSGRLTLLRLPSGLCGDWFRDDTSSSPYWHRRLTAAAFLWLREAVEKAVRSNSLPEDASDAPARLEEIRKLGITEGVFTEDDVADGILTPAGYSFSYGLPVWAEDSSLSRI